jgi:hypothetical protein
MKRLVWTPNGMADDINGAYVEHREAKEALKRIMEIASPPDKVNTQGEKLDLIYDIAMEAINGA